MLSKFFPNNTCSFNANLPDAAESDGGVVAAVDVPGETLAVGVFGPFIEAGGEDQAAAVAAGGFEGGFLGDGLGAGVDQEGAAVGGLVPMR